MDPAKCMGCGVCEDRCPIGAISLRREPSEGRASGCRGIETSRGSMTSDATAQQVKAGQAPYSKLFLSVDDPLVRFNCKFIWKCHPSRAPDLYNEHLSANHLDVGVATGSLLDCCRFPAPNPRLALMDLNTNSLRIAAKRGGTPDTHEGCGTMGTDR